jgi:hypothetical protein
MFKSALANLLLLCQYIDGLSDEKGMNEIAGPLYYVFASDPDPQWQGKFINSLPCL